jgi:nicotinate-nucleotide adenylyltransferase
MRRPHGRWDAIGVFGGTFDPIHFGHLRTAFECQVRLGLGEVRFIPCADPPHRGAPAANARARLRMVEAAIAGTEGFIADAREFEREGPSFTIDTLHSLQRDFPGRTLCLLLGVDAFAGLAGWREWESLFDCAHIVVARRPGATIPATGLLGEALRERAVESVAGLRASSQGRILIVDVTQLDIASTDIRASIAAGVRPLYLMPDSVWRVIVESECYDA